MKRQIRRNVFETNSSMTHSLTICSEEDYTKFENGEMYYDIEDERLVPVEEVKIEDDDDRIDYYLTSEEYDDRYGEYNEMYSQKFSTPSGEKMVAFGYYGHD